MLGCPDPRQPNGTTVGPILPLVALVGEEPPEIEHLEEAEDYQEERLSSRDDLDPLIHVPTGTKQHTPRVVTSLFVTAWVLSNVPNAAPVPQRPPASKNA